MTNAPSPPLSVAHQAFDRFTHGLTTGEWQAFIAMLTEDVTFWFSVGPASIYYKCIDGSGIALTLSSP